MLLSHPLQWVMQVIMCQRQTANLDGDRNIDRNYIPAPLLNADYYSISNQWQRLRAEREAQAAMDLENRRIDAAQSEPSPPAVAEDMPRSVFYPSYYSLPPRVGPFYPMPSGERGPPSPRNAHVNTPPPVWPRER